MSGRKPLPSPRRSREDWQRAIRWAIGDGIVTIRTLAADLQISEAMVRWCLDGMRDVTRTPGRTDARRRSSLVLALRERAA